MLGFKTYEKVIGQYKALETLSFVTCLILCPATHPSYAESWRCIWVGHSLLAFLFMLLYLLYFACLGMIFCRSYFRSYWNIVPSVEVGRVIEDIKRHICVHACEMCQNSGCYIILRKNANHHVPYYHLLHCYEHLNFWDTIWYFVISVLIN